ncbi:hypothetical protein EV644_12054 [Kribbella orskensis]|uniref:Uncharacterized protein n=1 Tax=Kribbella orskensis TaxID=2512216 RepID=A0ABY2BB30_9ACTN|nr:hypothetical protein EV642_12265 [Kribbella sp. VKM Ac-2500]TCO14430.1 hypothetical protein EV644_12054 [Kribbella orskensis]
MRQHGDGSWSGHREVTYLAVDRLSRTRDWQAERDRRAALEHGPAEARRTAEMGWGGVSPGVCGGLSGGAVGAGG